LAVTAADGAIASPCAARPQTMNFDASYYQNASRVGGTALAAYPLFAMSTGIAPRVALRIDTPSQIAESGARGAGLYPITHFGYGVMYAFADTARSAFAASLDVVPPASLYAPESVQPKYRVGVSSGYRLARSITLKGTLGASTSHTAGFGTALPSSAFGADLGGAAASVSADVGVRLVSRRAAAQSFGDIAVSRSLRRKLTLRTGLGTAFNPVANTKAHYLSASLLFRP
jgi:hypothetical protein